MECKATLNLAGLEPFQFDMFGVEMVTHGDQEVIFNLYPFKTKKNNARIFYNYQITVQDKSIILSLFGSNNAGLSGINVEDSMCYQKIVDLFQRSAKKNKVNLNISATKSYARIVFIGELFVNNKSSRLLIEKIVTNATNVMNTTNATSKPNVTNTTTIVLQEDTVNATNTTIDMPIRVKEFEAVSLQSPKNQTA